MIKSARLTAFEILYKIFSDSAYSHIALDMALKTVVEDKAFISALVYGVVERKITLDFFIDKYVKSKLKPKIRLILRIGAYQILFMERVPSGIAIHESVKLARDIKQDYYAGFINAVLHNIDNDRQIPDDLSVKYSVPENLISMWRKQYSEDTVKEFLPCVNGRPPIFAVPNTQYLNADQLLYELKCEGIDGEIIDNTVMLTSTFVPGESIAFHNGLFYIEDLSSYKCAAALKALPGETVLDVCSAPGGKAFTIACAMKNQGRLLCFDLYEHRIKLIDDSAKRLGLDIIETSINDATQYNPNIPKADRVLCDVPCSGFGIIRRKPEIRYKELDSVKKLPELQLNILTVSSSYLKDFGTLIYSTCTLNKKENEKVVDAFLSENSGYLLEREKTFFPSSNSGDGFYYAVIKKDKNERGY